MSQDTERQAEATRQATRGRSRNFDPLWRLKAREDGRLRTHLASAKSGAKAQATRAEAVEAWMHVGRALATSGDVDDRKMAGAIAAFIREMPISQAAAPQRPGPEQAPKPRPMMRSHRAGSLTMKPPATMPQALHTM